jgi:phosphoglycerate dehydrogenase-like enzyme
MPGLIVAVTDSVFPNLDAARQIVSTVGAQLLLAKAATPEAILEVATTADAVLTTYAKVTAEMIQKMTRCRSISRFGIGVDDVDIATATCQGIVVTKVPRPGSEEGHQQAAGRALPHGFRPRDRQHDFWPLRKALK